jgi:hypoxanthine phosphoribosyltransferase
VTDPVSSAPPPAATLLIPRDRITARIGELAAEMTKELADSDEPPLLVGVLKGCALFLADLARQIPLQLEFDFMSISTYSQTGPQSGVVRILKDLDTDIAGRDVVIVEDIVDTGLTLHYLQEILLARGPRSLRTACLLSKPSRRKIEVKVDYIGFTIEDKFVVGYGLDYAEQYRNLPYIGLLE